MLGLCFSPYKHLVIPEFYLCSVSSNLPDSDLVESTTSMVIKTMTNNTYIECLSFMRCHMQADLCEIYGRQFCRHVSSTAFVCCTSGREQRLVSNSTSWSTASARCLLSTAAASTFSPTSGHLLSTYRTFTTAASTAAGCWTSSGCRGTRETSVVCGSHHLLVLRYLVLCLSVRTCRVHLGQ